jgi:rhodanese-related sulfurtransferase
LVQVADIGAMHATVHTMAVADDVDVSPERVRELGAEVQLVDVREPYEWEAGRLAGAVHVELALLAAKAATIDREQPVVFYCRVGARSWMAAGAFRRAGYDAYSMAGGIAAWHARGLPIEPDDGYVAEH